MNPGVDSVYRLVCMGCQAHNKNYREGFELHGGPLYSAFKGGDKKKMARWFTNLKGNLAKHIESDPHHSASRALLQESSLTNKVRDQIHNRMRYW